MNYVERVAKPSKQDRIIALESFGTLAKAIKKLNAKTPEIEIEETKDKIKLPLIALKLLAQVLEAMSKGNPVSIVPVATEVTTQVAADILSCSRVHLVKLLEGGEIPFTKVGRHRRIKIEDVLSYKEKMKEKREKLLIEIMKADEESGLYDT